MWRTGQVTISNSLEDEGADTIVSTARHHVAKRDCDSDVTGRRLVLGRASTIEIQLNFQRASDSGSVRENCSSSQSSSWM